MSVSLVVVWYGNGGGRRNDGQSGGRFFPPMQLVADLRGWVRLGEFRSEQALNSSKALCSFASCAS